MEKIYEKIKVHFENAHQIINMGGPWIGNLFLNGEFITTDVVIDNTINNRSKLFYVKYNEVSRWQKDSYFAINYYDLHENAEHQFQKKFSMLYLGNFVDDETIEIFEAFHNNNTETRRYFNIVTER